MIIRIYKRNHENLVDINYNHKKQIEIIKIQRYLNLIKKIKNNKIEVYTEQTELLYENDDYIIVSYKKILHNNELFPNLKVYLYDKNIDYWETTINVDENVNVKLVEKIKLINESINFLEIELNDDFKESYSIKTLLGQIEQQILNHK